MKYIYKLILLAISILFVPNYIIGRDYVSVPIPPKTKSIITHDSLPIVFFVIDNSNIMRSKVSLEAYSLENGYFLWADKLSNGEMPRLSHNGILFCKEGSTTLRDYYSGEKLWKQNITIRTCSPKDSIAYATANAKTFGGDKLFMIDLKSGKKNMDILI